MNSRHRKTSARRTLACAGFLSLQRQAISASAFAAGQKCAEAFAAPVLRRASLASLPQRRRTRPDNFSPPPWNLNLRKPARKPHGISSFLGPFRESRAASGSAAERADLLPHQDAAFPVRTVVHHGRYQSS